MSLNFTEQALRNIKDVSKRAQAQAGVSDVSGDPDLLAIVETPNGDNMAKFALELASQGHVRTRTARAWSMEEYQKLVAELP